MNKRDWAADFFAKLGQDQGDFIARMIEAEMDEDIIELFNQFGGRLQLGDMEPTRFQTSLLIIGYLVRAYEEFNQEADEDSTPEANRNQDNSFH
ncbi:MAG: hypothetical protein PVG60_01535 [Desulfarculaceae bacterium]|jgi:hypothetical protein